MAAATIAGMPVADALAALLTDRFGHQHFRPGQREVVDAVIAGRDALVVMPTGGGKSLCYQLPALVGDGTTLVISPLIALMKDQVDALQAVRIAAAALHSHCDQEEQRRIQAAYSNGSVALLYIAPERLVRSELRALLRAVPPKRIVVDEAHCISEWGHDFRRDYLRIGEMVSELAPVQVIACTATATPDVRDDIAARLGMRDPLSFIRGFERPNLHLQIERCRTEDEKLARLDQLIDPGDGHAIVYAGTRARAAALEVRLSGRFPTMLYHGDLAGVDRSRAQERFRSGAVRVAVTTSAFGMGVDIPTVRQVIHMALPGSLEEYYQQAGRAGRDGLAARCILLHAPNDRRLQEFFVEAAHPSPAVIAAVYRSLQRCGGDPGAWSLVNQRDPGAASLSDAAGNAARDLLRHAGAVDRAGRLAPGDDLRLPVDHGAVTAHRRLAFRRLEQLIAFLGRPRCRHRMLLEYFGEEVDHDCGWRCDRCSEPGETGRMLDAVVVRQALSAVARLNGRLGIARLAGVLVGSRSRNVLGIPGVERLSTYGVLRGWREADAAELLRRLVDTGALAQTSPPYATVLLTVVGVAAMRGEQALAIADPRSGTRAVAPALELTGTAQEQLGRLREWRAQEARRRGVPAYVVLHDRTLAELAARSPRSDADLLAVPGIGPGKLALYGASLRAVVAGDPDPAAGTGG